MKVFRLLSFWSSGATGLFTFVSMVLGQMAVAMLASYVMLALLILGLLIQIQIQADIIER